MKRLPNLVSTLRLLLSPVVLLLCWNGREEAAGVLFLSLALSDVLDGFLARRLRAESVVGKLLDPLADKFLLLTGLVCVTFLTLVRMYPPVFFLMLLRDLSIVAGTICLMRFGFVPEPSLWGKLTTVFLSIAVSLYFLSNSVAPLPLELLRLLDVASSVLILVSWADYGLKGLNFVRYKLIMERR